MSPDALGASEGWSDGVPAPSVMEAVVCGSSGTLEANRSPSLVDVSQPPRRSGPASAATITRPLRLRITHAPGSSKARFQSGDAKANQASSGRQKAARRATVGYDG